MRKTSIGIGLIVLFVVAAAIYYAGFKNQADNDEHTEGVSELTETAPSQDVDSSPNEDGAIDVKKNSNSPSDYSPSKAPENFSEIGPDGSPQMSPFSDENFDDWIKIGSSDFIEQKTTNPEKYKAGVEFLINTLKTGNVDKMLSQAGATLFNINDPDLTPAYENILNDPEANISPEGTMRILTLYIRQGQPESASFKKIIEKYQKHPDNAVRAVANRWQEFR